MIQIYTLKVPDREGFCYLRLCVRLIRLSFQNLFIAKHNLLTVILLEPINVQRFGQNVSYSFLEFIISNSLKF